MRNLTVRVEPVTPNDLAVLVKLCAEHARYERDAFEPIGKIEGLKIALFHDPVRLHAWIVRQGANALGYASASREFSTWAARDYFHLDCLFLREPVRGQGVGTLLLHTVADFAQNLGFDEMQWQTPAWNAAAIRFYERTGAQAKAKQRFALSFI